MMRSSSFVGALILAASFGPSECYTATNRSTAGNQRRSPGNVIHQPRRQQEYRSPTSLHSTNLMFRNGDEAEDVRSPVEFATEPFTLEPLVLEPPVPQWEVLRQLPFSSTDFLKMAVDLKENETGLWLGRMGMVAFVLLVLVEASTGQSIAEFLR